MSKTPTPTKPSTAWVTDSVQDTSPPATTESSSALISDETGATYVPANWALHREDGKLHALNLVTRQKYVGDVDGFNKLLRGE